MLEISGDDVCKLGDEDLRQIVYRLAVSELRRNGSPISSVTAGGNQDAPDGGIDVRVACNRALTNPDFVPKRLTGFQVKASSFSRSAILKEMCPKGLRNSIRSLIAESGAYIIVSSKGSLADAALRNRRQAMRDAIRDIPNAEKLYTDFYDRDRLATWVNEYPGLVSWLRTRVGRPIAGWSNVNDWSGSQRTKEFLLDDHACLSEERSHSTQRLSVKEGISKFREMLLLPGKCIRLIGMSGVGKTRFVQALFEESVGENSLDPSISLYTDYSEAPNPTARDMVRNLISDRQRTILIVDNCNPDTHTELTRLCAAEDSLVSLLTVEYDVGGDEPELTEVFRMQSSSREIVVEWIRQSFPNVSQLDSQKIADFSDGNFRVAAVLAETIGKGEALGSLKSKNLFERIFWQRNLPNQTLLKAAEELSLLYSIDGEDVSLKGELAALGIISGTGAIEFYEALAEMKRRGVVQSRGRWRAILPQAIANPLASRALERIPANHFDKFCVELPPRMFKSLTRRLSYLHDSKFAQIVADRWLRPDGPFGDLFSPEDERMDIVADIAPILPEATFARIEEVLKTPVSSRVISSYSLGNQWIRLLRSLMFSSELFEAGAILLARFVGKEPDNNNINSGLNVFRQFFYPQGSCTHATPEQRRAVIRELIRRKSDEELRCASIALEAMLQTNSVMLSEQPNFGARSRDWGWHPSSSQDIMDWYANAIALAAELAPFLDTRSLIANHLRGLWHYPSSRDALERISTMLLEGGAWIQGWIACRSALHYDGEKMPEEVRGRLISLVDRLKPSNLLDEARAYVLNRHPSGLDVSDGEEDNGDPEKSWIKLNKKAQSLGRVLANHDTTRLQFLDELISSQHSIRAFVFGVGLGEGVIDFWQMWTEIRRAFCKADPKARDATVMGGFLCGAIPQNSTLVSDLLESVMDDSDLVEFLPYFQRSVGLEGEGIPRLRRAIKKGVLVSRNFHSIANGSIQNSSPGDLAPLLEDIGELRDGVEVALDIFQMYFNGKNEESKQFPRLIEAGRKLLLHVNFSKTNDHNDYAHQAVARICLMGEDGRKSAIGVCERIMAELQTAYLGYHHCRATLVALFEVHPFVALDIFLLSEIPSRSFLQCDLNGGTAVESVSPKILFEWASLAPSLRYPRLGETINMFSPSQLEDGSLLSPLFLSLLTNAPDKMLFLGSFRKRLEVNRGGSFASILSRRKAELQKLIELFGEDVRCWVVDGLSDLDRDINYWSKFDQDREESFE
ncbi:MAG: hypothetical protein QM796_19305 [Chthoniobacteraceae bacterium]